MSGTNGDAPADRWAPPELFYDQGSPLYKVEWRREEWRAWLDQPYSRGTAQTRRELLSECFEQEPDPSRWVSVDVFFYSGGGRE